jgi:hypothetical protein
MKKPTVRELPGWPPGPGGAHRPGAYFPNAHEAVVNEMFPLRENALTFRCIFNGDSYSYHYFAESEKIARQLHALVQKNIGKTVAELGDLEIEI